MHYLDEGPHPVRDACGGFAAGARTDKVSLYLIIVLKQGQSCGQVRLQVSDIFQADG